MSDRSNSDGNDSLRNRMRQYASRPIVYEARRSGPSQRTWQDIKAQPKAEPTYTMPVPVEKKIAPLPVRYSSEGELPPKKPLEPFIAPPKEQPLAAQFTEPDPKAEPKQTKLFHPHRLSMALTGLALVAFAAGLMFGINGFRANNQAKTQVAALASNPTSAGVPAEQKPSGVDINSYQVAPNMPRFLIIPKIGVKARVTKLGLKSPSVMASPSNIYDTGWYDGSSLPGQTGAALIDGHVHGPTAPGVFVKLNKLVAGDTITIERGDGSLLNYKVVKSQAYPQDSVDMNAALAPVTPGKNGLNLITCTGSVSSATGEYNQRLVVFAEQV